MAWFTGVADDHKDLLALLEEFATADNVQTVAVNAGGTGYVVGDVLTVSGGTSTTPASVEVVSVSSGVVTGVRVRNAGAYSVDPTLSGASTTGGSGSGCTLNLTMQEAGWETERYDTGSEDELILKGSGSGSDEIFVGARTFSVGAISANNWELAGFTGFNNALPWANQPGISPGRWDNQSPIGGAFLPLRDVSFSYWISITSRRIVVVAQTGSNYHFAHLGFVAPFSTSGQYPYPLLIAGTSSIPAREATQSVVGVGGFNDPTANALADLGPALLRFADGTWRPLKNAYNLSGGRVQISDQFHVWPPCQLGSVVLPPEDVWGGAGATVVFRSNRIIPVGVGGTPTFRFDPTPNTGGALYPVFPLTIVSFSAASIVAEIEGAVWVSGSTGGGSPAVPGDSVTAPSGERYRLFPSVNRAEPYNMWGLLEG